MAERKEKADGLRTGYSTGACAAAASRAAMEGLVTGKVPEQIQSLLPNGQRVVFQVARSSLNTDFAQAVVIKDAGDDPDVTDKAQLTASLTPLRSQPGVILIEGGPGVGRVTLPGLGLLVGGPAINPKPRQNILDNISEVGADWLKTSGVLVTISVPDGEKMAKRTLNARLGIVDGISILGTSGIVRAFSTAAYRACVVQGVEVAASQGLSRVVLSTGGRTEKFIIKQFPDLPEACFVQMGDFLGAALDRAAELKIKKISIGAMVGKLTKIAQGERVTHARKNQVDTGLLARLAAQVGAGNAVCKEIELAQTARFASERLAELGLDLPFYQALIAHTLNTLHQNYSGAFSLDIWVCDFEGNYITSQSDQGAK
ncbi:MAG: cobalt-precorrin-5B (C(1))-methyltransferase [Candidatus Lambdaproteobacteria bacterium RIFOXYD2_FULL_50_16]|uniref:Cobalt-precorrin-5B C(1)-methyltransferase n=1 Tax=Candidatus Lambdaproteobacteria bacterium RIFOXYD2_FULL_50_16 TaxID=1817772 RepID=A0A1F6G8V9_9PROT|nr:MAG: cobalt-precorrin-5B (C(1))-methyltransferase [Candidatus Lambdaproteobacteria bacterium RIFOXYD2_FULL_50_16]